MSERGDYKTRQREAVLKLYASLPGRPLTAGEAYQELTRLGMHIGRTTVYRCIAMLHEKGHLIAFKDQQSPSPVRYQHRGLNERRISVRCTGCGMIAALACDAVSEFEQHLSLDHGFTLNQEECLLPGLCSDCRKAMKPTNPEPKGNR